MNVDELARAARDRAIAPERFLRELWRLSEGHTRQGRTYLPGNVDLYRSRCLETDVRPAHIQDLSYPPLEVVTLGRANKAGEQIFYCSAGVPTTLAESRVRAGQYLVSSRWVNTETLVLQSVGFVGEHVELEKLYHDIFTSRDEATYEYSSQIASHLMTGPEICGLLYPSIINQNQSHNVALKASFVDKGLRMRYASVMQVKSITSDSKYEVEEIDFAKPDEHGQLIWTGAKRKWVLENAGDELRMEANGWEWNAYLPDGTYVEPE